MTTNRFLFSVLPLLTITGCVFADDSDKVNVD